MIISDKEYKEIQIITNDGELIASITDEDVIEKMAAKLYVCLLKFNRGYCCEFYRG